jgi:HK97 family phage portal protein
MGIKSFLHKITEPKEVKTSDSINNIFLTGTNDYNFGLSPSMAYWLFEKSDTIGSAVDLISWAFQSMQPILKDKTNNEYVSNHPALELLNNPGYQVSSERLKYELMASFLLTSECYPVLLGNVDYEPTGIYSVNSCNANLMPADDMWLGKIIFSAVWDMNAYTRQTIPKRKIWVYQRDNRLAETIQIINIRRRILYRGQSVLERVYYQAASKYFGNIHNAGILKNGSRPSGMWSPKEGSFSQEQYEEFKKEIKDNFMSPANAGKNIIAPRPIQYDNLMLNIRDMDFVKLIENSRAEIYSQFQIPLAMVLPETMTMNNYSNAIVAFYDQAVLPRAKFIFKLLGQFILGRYKDGDKFEMIINEKSLSALQERLFTRVKMMRDTYTFSENELRAEAGYEVSSGGNEIYKPATWIPAGMDIDETGNIETETTSRTESVDVKPVEEEGNE